MRTAATIFSLFAPPQKGRQYGGMAAVNVGLNLVVQNGGVVVALNTLLTTSKESPDIDMADEDALQELRLPGDNVRLESPRVLTHRPPWSF